MRPTSSLPCVSGCLLYTSASDILRGVKLEVRKGELFAILGGNGVGKTTTLKALTRLIKPYRGTIEISGKRLETLSDAELSLIHI